MQKKSAVEDYWLLLLAICIGYCGPKSSILVFPYKALGNMFTSALKASLHCQPICFL